MTTRNLILGLGYGYDEKALFPFVASLRRTGFVGEVCILIDRKASPRTLEFLARHHVVSVPAEPQYPFTPLPVLPGYDPSDFTGMAPHLWRYAAYRQYLEGAGDRYKNVFLVDVRDVFFQRDPFEFDGVGAPLVVFLEEAGHTIGGCHFNTGWIQRQVGIAAWKQVADHPISCSGTTLGTYSGIVVYLDRLLSELTRRRCVEVGGDQGIHNYLIHSGAFPGAVIMDNDHGPVLTLHHHSGKVRFDDQGRVLNTDGQVVNVVHQYDRHPELEKRLLGSLGRTRRRPGLATRVARRAALSLRSRVARVHQALLSRSFSASTQRAFDGDEHHVALFLFARSTAPLEGLLRHYRSLGIQRVFIVDRGLTPADRTRLAAASGIHVLRPRLDLIPDDVLLKQALEAHGHDRWCLVVDPPARFIYAHCNTLPLPTLCRYLDERGATSLRAFPSDSRTGEEVWMWVDGLFFFRRGMRIATRLTPGVSDAVPLAMRAVIEGPAPELSGTPLPLSSQVDWDELARLKGGV